MAAQRHVVVERLEVRQDFVGGQRAAHVPGQHCDARREEGRAAAEVREDDLDVRPAALLAGDDEVRGRFEGLVGHLRNGNA